MTCAVVNAFVVERYGTDDSAPPTSQPEVEGGDVRVK